MTEKRYHCSTLTSYFLSRKPPGFSDDQGEEQLEPERPKDQGESEGQPEPESPEDEGKGEEQPEASSFRLLKVQPRKERLIICSPYDVSSSRGLGNLAAVIKKTPPLFKKYRAHLIKALDRISQPERAGDTLITKKLELVPGLLAVGQKTKVTALIAEAEQQVEKHTQPKAKVLAKIRVAQAMSYISEEMAISASQKIVEVYQEIKKLPIAQDIEIQQELANAAAQITTPDSLNIMQEVIKQIPKQKEKTAVIAEVAPKLSGQFKPVGFTASDLGSSSIADSENEENWEKVISKPGQEWLDEIPDEEIIRLLDMEPLPKPIEIPTQPPDVELPSPITTDGKNERNWEKVISKLGEEWLGEIQAEQFSEPTQRPRLITVVIKMLEQFRESIKVANQINELFDEVLKRCQIDFTKIEDQLEFLEELGHQAINANQPERVQEILALQETVQRENNQQEETLFKIRAKELLGDTSRHTNINEIIDEIKIEQLQKYPTVACELAKGLIMDKELSRAIDVLETTAPPAEQQITALADMSNYSIVTEQEEKFIQVVDNLLSGFEDIRDTNLYVHILLTTICVSARREFVTETNTNHAYYILINEYSSIRRRELSEEDHKVIEQTVDIYANTLVSSYMSNASRATLGAIRTTVVRDEILTRVANRAATEVELFASGSDVESLTPLERELVQVSEDTFTPNGPKLDPYKTLRMELEDTTRRSPTFTATLRSEINSFQKTSHKKDISHSLVNHLTAAVFEGGNESQIGRFVQDIVSNSKWLRPRSGAGLRVLHEAQSKQFVLELAKGNSIEDSIVAINVSSAMKKLQPVMATIINDLPLGNINTTLRNFPPALGDVLEPHVDITRAVTQIDGFRNARSASSGGGGLNLADAVTSFGDWFPGQLGADTRTPRGRLVAKWNPSSIQTSTPRSFARARSFSSLRGFSRVGGVLIGQDPINTKKGSVEFVDFDWKIGGKKISLILTDNNGQTHRSLPYRSSVAYYALSYAADGRPLAATMVTATPMPDLKILLHPTLIDTPMGRRIIEFDRFVDRYTGDDERRTEAGKMIYAQNALYHLAWAHRINRLIEAIASQESNEYSSMLTVLAERVISSEKVRVQAEEALGLRARLDDPNYSILKAKDEFYDAQLVSLIIEQAKRSYDLASFERGLQSQFHVTNIISLLNDKNKLRALFVPPPEFQIWSGVREKAFKVNPENLLIQDKTRPTFPLEFILQVAFTSPPMFLSNYDPDKADSYSDTNPWEFPYLAEEIHQKTLMGIQNDPEDGRSQIILDDAIEFTYLQRLFRSALDGHLGSEFPVEKLVDLIEDLEPTVSIEKVRTLRWNAIPAALFSLRLITSNAEEKNLLEQLRKALGIQVDEEQIRRDMDVPLPNLN